MHPTVILLLSLAYVPSSSLKPNSNINNASCMLEDVGRNSGHSVPIFVAVDHRTSTPADDSNTCCGDLDRSIDPKRPAAHYNCYRARCVRAVSHVYYDDELVPQVQDRSRARCVRAAGYENYYHNNLAPKDCYGAYGVRTVCNGFDQV
ncbi:hypothetical protein B0H16DRAFT_1899805, partial [Mycena metata]